MSATISGAVAGLSGRGEQDLPVRITFESGHHQDVRQGGCRVLETGQGGVTGISGGPRVRFALFSGTSCQGSRALASGSGTVTFGTPVLAGAVVIG
nr:hypothetical protein [Nocardiopsis algeriensis]